MAWLHVHLRLTGTQCPAARSRDHGQAVRCLHPGRQPAPLVTCEGPAPEGWDEIARTAEGTLAVCTGRTCAQCPAAGLSRHAIVIGATVHRDAVDLDLAVRSREALSRILQDLEQKRTHPRLMRLSQNGGVGSHPVLVDMARMTPRQLQTLRVAAEQGYFRPGSKVMLDDLAPLLKVSKSTLHEHLQKGISVLVEEAVGPPTRTPRDH